MNKCPNVKTCRRIRTRVNNRTKRNRKITNIVGKITVHQIFGLMGDKILPPLFKKSKEAFIKFCKRNGYKYKFWNKKMCSKSTSGIRTRSLLTRGIGEK